MNNKINKIFSLIERMEHRSLGSLLNESQESTSQKEAIRYIEQNKGWSHEKADNFVRVTLRNDIPSIRDKKIAKFTLGVTRMFFDGEINNERIINDLNETLKLLSAHLNEYDRNLNGLSAQELIDRFKQVRLDNANAERAEIDAMNFSGGSDYTIVPINSFKEAEKYYEYTNPDDRWCLTHMKNMFDTYTRGGINQIYFCLQNGFENVPRQVGDKAPLDEYGLSMLSVIVNEDGGLAYCTTRWNHKNGGSDSAMSAKEVSQVVGVNFYNTFKPNNKWANIIETVKQDLANGESPYDVFDYVDDFKEGIAKVELDGRYNLINQEGQLVSKQWFDYIYNFKDGFALVELNDKRNLINQEGQLTSKQWFDYVGNFKDGFARVELNDKYNFINQEGQLISNQWYDGAGNFEDGFVCVELNGKYNFINQEGQLISKQWFDYVGNFKDGFARVELNDKYNFINQEGQLVSKQWFDYIYNFKDGFALVELNDKRNLINQEGQLTSKQWFDYVGNFKDGFARVELNDKYNFINQEGQLISNQWYDGAGNFKDGFAPVELNDKFYRIDTNGRLHNINENKEYKISKNMSKKKIRLTENELKQIVAESVKKVLNETDYHRAYSSAKKLDGFGLKDTITDDEVFECLDTLQKKLEQERKNASTGQFSGNGESINFLVASIRGLQAFIKSRY